MLEGSYSFTASEFKGKQSTPLIDLIGPDPGPGWEPVDKQAVRIESNAVIAILYHGNAKEALISTLGPSGIS